MNLLKELISESDRYKYDVDHFPEKQLKKDSPTDAKVRKAAIDMMRKVGVPSTETDKLKTCSIAEVKRQVALFQRHVAAFRGSK